MNPLLARQEWVPRRTYFVEYAIEQRSALPFGANSWEARRSSAVLGGVCSLNGGGNPPFTTNNKGERGRMDEEDRGGKGLTERRKVRKGNENAESYGSEPRMRTKTCVSRLWALHLTSNRLVHYSDQLHSCLHDTVMSWCTLRSSDRRRRALAAGKQAMSWCRGRRGRHN